jgi:CheY-like chemotaxis protein
VTRHATSQSRAGEADSNVSVAPSQSGQGEVVLVVEDEHRVRDVTVTPLTGLGYRVLEAGSGTEAMEVLGRHPEVEVVFSDLVMPGELSGLELAKRLQLVHPKMRVILTSGYSAELVHEWGAGLDLQVLRKPYRPAELARIFHHALQSRCPQAEAGAADGPA